jgi:hypothetical protein
MEALEHDLQNYRGMRERLSTWYHDSRDPKTAMRLCRAIAGADRIVAALQAIVDEQSSLP